MKLLPQVGDRVRHDRYGDGTVLRRRGRHYIRVRFDAAPELTRTFPPSQVTVLDVQNSGGEVERRGRRRVEPRSPARGPRGGGQRPVVPRLGTDVFGPSLAASRSLSDTELRSDPPDSAGGVPSGLASERPSVELAERRQVLEALRLGVVPARDIADYTVARGGELGAFDGLLAQRRGFLGVVGEYGTGKTHLLDLFEQRGRDQGFLVARVTIDPREHTATNPKRLYRAIVEALRYPGEGGSGIDPLMQRLVDSPEHATATGRSMSRFFSPYLWACSRGDEETLGWVSDWILGDRIDGHEVDGQLRRIGWRGPRLLTLSDYRTYGRVYMHLVGVLSSWAEDAGYRGLLMLFDEVEFIDGLSAQAYHYAREVLRHVAAVTASPADLAFDPEALYRGGHEVHRKLPLRFRDDQPLAAVFALTPLGGESGRVLESLVKRSDMALQLRRLGERDTLDLVRRVIELYRRAYPGFSPCHGERLAFIDRVEDVLADEGIEPRPLVQATVCELDGLRLRRQATDRDADRVLRPSDG